MKRSISVSLIIAVIMATFSTVSIAADINIAVGKRYTAANQYNSSSYSVNKAFDGNMNTAYSAGYEDLEGKLDGSYNYITVDLGGTYEITNVNVRSRRDLDQAASRNGWSLQGSLDKSFSSPVLLGVKNSAGTFGSDLEVTLPEGSVFRYLRVISTNIMVISEFEVYGTLVELSKGYSDIGEELYNENMLNSYLNLVEPLKTNEFGINSVLKYEEACKIILKCLNEYNEEQLTEGFMEKCTELKLCDDDISKKNKYIKTAAFAKMAIRALGFGELLDNKYTGEDGTKVFADRIGLSEDIKWKNGSYLTRENALRFAYNMMLIKTCEPETVSTSVVNYGQTGETLLEKKFDLIYKEGQVTANSVTTLHEARNAQGVVIAGVSYTDACGDVEALIGRKVRFLTDMDNNIVIVWEDYEKFESVVINACDILQHSLKEIRVQNENGKTKRYRLDNIYSVLKNGVAFNDYTSQTFVPQNGEIELIDSDKNGNYDIINVWHPEIVICSGISVTDRKIILVKDDGTNLLYDKFDVCITEINGINVAPEDFTLSNLLYVYASENGKYVRIASSTNTVSGTITEISDEEKIKINDEEYLISDYCLNDAESMDRIKIGNVCTVLIDTNGYIVWVERNQDLREEENLGFLVKMAVGAGISSKIEFKIFRQDSQFAIYEAAEQIRVDGEKYSRSKLAKLIREDATFKSAVEDGFVVFTLNNLGYISDLDTERETSKDNVYSKLKKFADASNFYRTGNMLAAGSKMIMPIENDTPLFIVPTDRSMEEKYYVTTVASRMNSGRTETAQCSFYGADEYGYPSFGLIDVTFKKVTEKVGIIDNYSVNFAVVEKIMVTDIDGEQAYSIRGYNLSDGSKVDFKTTDNSEIMIDKRKLAFEKSGWINTYGAIEGYDDTISNYFLSTGELGKGDIIAYRQSNNQLTALERVFDADSNERQTNYIHRHGEYYSSLPLYCDKVMMFGTYETFNAIDKKIKISVGNNEYVYNADSAGGIYYKDNGKSFEKISLDSLLEYVYEGSRIMLYIERGVLKGIYAL